MGNAENEVQRLAEFLLENYAREIGAATSESAVDVAIRLLGPALHASAPAGMRCADCSIDQEPCPACYTAAWTKRHVNVRFVRDEIPIREIARVCHEVNRTLTAYAEDVPMQPPWEACDSDMKESTIHGVVHALSHPNASPEEQHDVWMRERQQAGWVFGPTKDVEKKTHPAIRPYNELSKETRLKDAVFQAIVAAFR